MSTTGTAATTHAHADSIAFDQGVFRAELEDIKDRHNRTSRPKITDVDAKPSTALGLTGVACSGGGIRSASFCLGVLQGLQSKKLIRDMDYLSTVSGGGYIGTMMSIGMSCSEASPNADGTFPFGRLDDENRETPELRHLRDNSRYLVQDGVRSVISAIVIYLRGIAMNVLVLAPLLLLAAALLLSLNPNTKELVTNRFLWFNLTGVFGDSRVPFTILLTLIVAGLLVVYAIVVSVKRIAPLKNRRRVAGFAGWIFFAAFVVVLLELHSVLLRLVFESDALKFIQYPAGQDPAPKTADLFTATVGWIRTLAIAGAPVVVAILPFLNKLAAKAGEVEGGSWGDLAKRIGSRLALLVVAAIVPVLLWLAMMQLTFWGTAVSVCPDGKPMPTTCADVVNNWKHAPALLQSLFGDTAGFFWLKGAAIYVAIAAVLLLSWLVLSVNANSLQQLYRDRLGGAFLVMRKSPNSDEVLPADEFALTALKPSQAPYHLINTALNVPGSPFANRRGRNADFFVFSRRYIGSEATGYVDTERAQKAVDSLNIGTTMAISGAAAAPNMGMASIRPLSPTIALLNVRLGRWLRHPRDIAKRMARWEEKQSKEKGRTKTDSASGEHGEHYLWRVPGPRYLLREAFAKSGATVKAQDIEQKDSGFVFLTDGGHVDNLGIYELLRRRCRLIIAVDAEADPDMDGESLVQVERFARIDMNVVIRMNWKPIATRSCAISEEIRKNALQLKHGPHVAVGLIDYPPSATSGGKRETGVLVYIKASMSGDENDYVVAYKARYPAFPHESTADQLFSEEQFEAYRALGEHIARRFVCGEDSASVFLDKTVFPDEQREEADKILHEVLPGAKLATAATA